MIDITVKVTGLDELKETLDKKAKQAVKNYIRRAAKDAADIWIKAIRENAESAFHGTGFLASHINVETHYLDQGSRLEVYVGPDPKAFYAMFREFGTRFQAAHPFVRPAFEEHKDDVLQAFAEALKVSLTEMETK